MSKDGTPKILFHKLVDDELTSTRSITQTKEYPINLIDYIMHVSVTSPGWL